MEQTAVEYAIQEIEKLVGIKIARDEDVIIKSKEIQKQQIIQILNDGKRMGIRAIKNKSAEQYYNETFKSE